MERPPEAEVAQPPIDVAARGTRFLQTPRVQFSYLDPAFRPREDHLEIIVNEVRGHRIHRVITFGVRPAPFDGFAIIDQAARSM